MEVLERQIPIVIRGGEGVEDGGPVGGAVEEQAEGGDMLAVRSRARSGYLAGYARVAEGGGVRPLPMPADRD